MPRAAHIEGDRLGGLIVSGAVWPDQEPKQESRRQMRLNVRNRCLLARSFADAGFVPVIDYVVVDRSRLGLYRQQLAGIDLRFVVLHPGREVALRRDRERPEKTVAAAFAYLEAVLVEELSGTGLWIASGSLSAEETVAAIVRDQERARVPASGR
jgi:hypothetical protein